MEMQQHRRPLWVGLIACAITPPAVFSVLTELMLLRAPILLVIPQSHRLVELVFLTGLIFSSAMTFSLGLIVLLWLKRIFRLNMIYVCAAGAMTGALFGYLLGRGEQLRNQAAFHIPSPPVFNGMTLGTIETSAWVGLLAAVVLCVGSGIPMRSVRWRQVEGGLSKSVFGKLNLVFAITVIALSALVLTPLVTPLFSPNKPALPNFPNHPPRSVDPKSWDRTCPKSFASPDDPTLSSVDTDIAQLWIETGNGDTTALRKLTQFAESGNALAQYRLGALYDTGCHDGIGIAKDAIQAAHWLELAARKGNFDAASRLGVLYQSNDGMPKNLALSGYWFNQAVMSSEGNSFVARGQLIRKVAINGVPQWPDVTNIVSETRVLAERNNAEAQYDLGEMFANGMAGRVDFTQAAFWYQKAAMQGNAAAQCNLGLMYKLGRGVPQGTTQTISWLTNAAMQNDTMAAYSLGEIYQFGEHVPKDLSTAAHWYSVAASHGGVRAQGALADMYARGDGLPKDEAKALQWFLIFYAHPNATGSWTDVRQLEAGMTPDQKSQAEQAARDWWKNYASLAGSTLAP